MSREKIKRWISMHDYLLTKYTKKHLDLLEISRVFFLVLFTYLLNVRKQTLININDYILTYIPWAFFLSVRLVTSQTFFLLHSTIHSVQIITKINKEKKHA
jgi:hypothetical protein